MHRISLYNLFEIEDNLVLFRIKYSICEFLYSGYQYQGLKE